MFVSYTLTNEQRQFVDSYFLSSDEISCLSICHDMISFGLCSAECYRSGKPKIYPYVVSYIDSLYKNGYLEIVSFSTSDIVFKIV